jgi:DNA-binding CsgD family transcriptional regulator
MPAQKARWALGILRRRGVSAVAPHVAGRIGAIAGVTEAQVELLGERLTAGQLSGMRVLPDPWPLAEDEARTARSATPHAAERVLLGAALSVSDRIDVLLSATGINAGVLTSVAIRAALRFSQGRYEFVSERARSSAIATADPRETDEMHHALALAHRRLGLASAAWHAFRAGRGDARRMSRDLVVLGERLLGGGNAEAAYRVAQAVDDDADPAVHAQAALLRGRAAIALGCLDDARDDYTRAAGAGNPVEIRDAALRGLASVTAYFDGPPAGDDPFQRQDGQRRALEAAVGSLADREVKSMIDATSGAWWTTPEEVDAMLAGLALSLVPAPPSRPWSLASGSLTPLVEAYARGVLILFLLHADRPREATPVLLDALARLPLTHVLGGVAHSAIGALARIQPGIDEFRASFEEICPDAPVRYEIDRNLVGETTAAASQGASVGPSRTVAIRTAGVLTSRETDVFEHVIRGLRNRDIGARMSISERTVEVHLTSIFRKLKVEGRSELIAKAFAQQEVVDAVPQQVHAS